MLNANDDGGKTGSKTHPEDFRKTVLNESGHGGGALFSRVRVPVMGGRGTRGYIREAWQIFYRFDDWDTRILGY